MKDKEKTRTNDKYFNGIKIESGINNCHWNYCGKCTNLKITRRKVPKNYSRDWTSKMNCSFTILGTNLCSCYVPVDYEEKQKEKQTINGEQYFVYAGYTDSNIYDASNGSIYKLHIFDEVEEVIEFKKEFYRETIDKNTGEVKSDCSNVIFSIFKGKRMKMIPVVEVTKWALVDDSYDESQEENDE